MIYAFLRGLLKILCKILFRVSFEGRENVPREGGLIVVANHVSHLDPIIVGIALDRPVYFMAKEELFQVRLLGSLLAKLNAFPVRRGTADRRAIQRSLELLEEGKVLGMFPEGRRSEDGVIGTLHHGPSTFAYKTGVPILPVGIMGTGEALKKGTRIPKLRKVHVRIGEPMHFIKPPGERATKLEIIEATNKSMEAISFLVTGKEMNKNSSSSS